LPPIGLANLSDHPPVEAAPVAWLAGAPVVPNFSEWEPGDVILVGDGSWLIQFAQAASSSRLSRVGRRFTHTGIYAGAGELIDSTTADGIQIRPVADYRHRVLALRRLPGITQTQRLDIVAGAQQHVGKSYGWWQAAASKLIPRPLQGFIRGYTAESRLYCSALVREAVDDGCGVNLDALPMYRPLYPATLSQHAAFDEIDLEWRPTI